MDRAITAPMWLISAAFMTLSACSSGTNSRSVSDIDENLSQDAVVQATCGDGLCAAGESAMSCPQDCAIQCGDGVCGAGESPQTCAQDCQNLCGDGVCGGGESSATCVEDCGSQCNDGSCNGAEDSVNCPADCEAQCGDEYCAPGVEDCGTCAGDCPCPSGQICENHGCVAIPPPESTWPEYDSNPYVFDLDQPQVPEEIRGSLFVHDLDGDGLMDFIVTGPNVVGAYDHWGTPLWKKDSNINLPGSANGGKGYPGTHAPGAIAGDMDGDGAAEVAYLTASGVLRIHDAASGKLEKTHEFPGAQAIAIANLRGKGDRDAVLQYSQNELRAVNLQTGQTLWHQTQWFGIEHSQVRVVDLNGDGLDEVVGAIFLDSDGKKSNSWDLKKDYGTALGSLDSIAIGDVVPGGCLEVAMAEQGGNNASLLMNNAQIYWSKSQKPSKILPTGQCKNEKDPDKVVVGEFDPSRPGLEVFARSSCSHHPWVHDAKGKIIAMWNLQDTAPPGWLYYDGKKEYGIEEIWAIDWTGDAMRHLLLKERHVEGKAAIVNAMTGKFVKVFNVSAARVYGADIAGDYREEVIILSSGEKKGRISVYWNANANNQVKARPWEVQYYRRSQQNWNYYSPGAGSPSLSQGMGTGDSCDEPDPCGDKKCKPGVEDCGNCPGDCPCPKETTCKKNKCVADSGQ